MRFQTFTVAVLSLTIILWPVLMTRVAWGTANCDFSTRGCGLPILYHAFVFLAPIVWLLITLHLSLFLRLIIFEVVTSTPLRERDNEWDDHHQD